MTFNKLGLNSMIERTCEKIQYHTPTAIQSLAIPSILSGKSVIANSETGSGKTAAFGLPLVHKLSKDPYSIFAVIITPTIELAIQINEQMAIFGQGINMRRALIIGKTSISKQIDELENYPHVVIGTPGRMRDMLEKCPKFKQDIERVEFVVLDEADRLFQHTLLPDMLRILKSAKQFKQMVLATATIDENFEGKKLKQLLQLNVDFVKHSTYEGIKTVSTATLTQSYIFTPEQLKPSYLLSILDQNSHFKIIIFLKTCKQCTLMAQTLKSLNYSVVALHSFMRFNQRIANLGMFRTDKVKILVTTDLTSRGLDIDNVNLVINYHLPRKVSDYVHRVGRTARNGFDGEAINFVTQHQEQLFLSIEKAINVQIKELSIKQNLEKLSRYNKAERECKINLLSSGVLGELQKKKQAKRQKKLQMQSNNKSPQIHQ